MDKLSKVLLFSKDKECRQCLSTVTSRCSNTVESYSEETEMLNAVRSGADMVIMALNSTQDGKPLCEVIRSINKHLPIILISDKSGQGDYSLYFKGVDTLPKPIDAEVLLRKVKLYKTLTEASITLENIAHNRREEDVSKKL